MIHSKHPCLYTPSVPVDYDLPAPPKHKGQDAELHFRRIWSRQQSVVLMRLGAKTPLKISERHIYLRDMICFENAKIPPMRTHSPHIISAKFGVGGGVGYSPVITVREKGRRRFDVDSGSERLGLGPQIACFRLGKTYTRSITTLKDSAVSAAAEWE